jgi:hypothetical protein
VSSLSVTEEIEFLSFIAISRIACRISGDRVSAILSFGGFPDGGLAMRESYNASYLNVHKIFLADIIREK